MSEFLLVPRAQMDEFLGQMQRLITLHTEIMQGAGTAVLPGAATPAAPSVSVIRTSPPQVSRQLEDDGKVSGLYLIRRGALSYADVVAREIPDLEFSFDDVAQRIEPLILIRSSRWRESLRRSLEKDERFERFEGLGSEERYRRVSMETRIQEELPKATNDWMATEDAKDGRSANGTAQVQERMPWDDDDDDLPF